MTVYTDGTTIAGDGSIASPLTAGPSAPPLTAINVKSSTYGAVGDGTTDDTAALQAAADAMIATGLDLYFPPGRYKTAKDIFLTGAIQGRVWGYGATIVYPSANVDLIGDESAPGANAERSAFCLRYCHDIAFEGLTFEGSQSPVVDKANVGSAVWAQNCQRITLYRCTQRYGASLLQQGTQACTRGAGDSISVADGIVTVSKTLGGFQAGHRGLRIAIWGCTYPMNNGVFTVTSVSGSTALTIDNPQAVSETSAFVWEIEDRDWSATIHECQQDRARSINSLPSYSRVVGNIFRWPTETLDVCGVGDQLIANATTITLTDRAGRFTPHHQGKYIKISNATSSGNNNYFGPITYISATQISFPPSAEAAGVTESFGGQWWIMNGKKVGLGSDAGALVKQSSPITGTVDAIAGTLTRSSGDWVTDGFVMDGVAVMSGFVNSGNNVAKTIKSVTPTVLTFYSSANLVSETHAATVTNNSMKLTVVGTPFDGSEVGASLLLRNPSNNQNRDSNWAIVSVPATKASPINYLYFDITGSTAMAEDFKGIWTIDDFDFSGGVGTACGSTHCLYIFAANDFAGDDGDHGRSHTIIEGNWFVGNRTTCIKCSGTATPLRDVIVRNNYFRECDAIVVFGADDAQQHTGLSIIGNVATDCGPVHRRGMVGDDLITVLGASSVNIADNQFYFSRDSVFHQYMSTGGLYAIQCERYATGSSQPLDDVTIRGNKFNTAHDAVSSAIFDNAIRVQQCGIKSKYRSGGALTKQTSPITGTINALAGTLARTAGSWIADGYTEGLSATLSGFVNGGNNVTKTIASMTATVLTFTDSSGLIDETHSAEVTNNLMTLMTFTEGAACFLAVEDIGKEIVFVNAQSGANDGTYAVVGVPTKTSLTFYNALGVAGTLGGTYRLPGRAGLLTGSCKIFDNEILGAVATNGIYVTNSSPFVRGNTFQSIPVNVYLDRCWFPVVTGNMDLGVSPNLSGGGGIQPRLRLLDTNSWPTVYDNYTCAGTAGGGNGRQWDIATATTTDHIQHDHPLLGKTVRARASKGMEEVVFAYGANFVDGDTFTLTFGTSTVFTYKSTSPTGNQFNSLISLRDLINTLGADLTAADYGKGFDGGDVDTGHIAIRRTVASTSDANIKIASSTLNPNALVILRNESSTNAKCDSRGSGSAGGVDPIPDKVVFWSPLAAYSGTAVIVAANVYAQSVAKDNGAGFPLKNVNDSGACQVFNVGDCSHYIDPLNPANCPEYRGVL